MISKTYYRYVWLLDTLLQKELTFEEIVKLWKGNPMHKEGLPLRTFHEHRKGIKEMFGVNIECKKSNGYVYYVKNPEVIERSKSCKWLLNTYSVPQDFVTYYLMKDRIILEEIPSGTAYAGSVIEAMRENKELEIDYQEYGKSLESLQVQPYALKVYQRQWYLLGKISQSNTIRNLALDRILDLRMSDKYFVFPHGFDARKYYKNSVGIIVNEDIPLTKVKIRVYGEQAEYIRSFPIHKSQLEVRSVYGEFSEFTYLLSITPDLVTQILTMGDNVEVLEPEELRHKIKCKLQSAIGRY